MHTAVVDTTAEAPKTNWPGSCVVFQAFRGLTAHAVADNRRSAKKQIGQGPVLFSSTFGALIAHCGRWQNR